MSQVAMKRRVTNKDNVEGGPFRASSGVMKKKGSSSKLTVSLLLLAVVSLIGIVIYQKQYYQQEAINMLKEEGAKWDAKQKALIKEIDIDAKDKDSTLEKLKNRVDRLQTELNKNDEHRQELENVIKNKVENEEKTGEIENANDLLQKQIEHLRKEIQRNDKHAALEKFGEGPHRVKFELEFPPNEVPEGTKSSFIIELAPLDLMPHTVRLFLEQASRGLLDGCSFHRNAGHVVQGGPVTNHLSQGINLRKPFTDADLNSVTFQEYHADYPHKKYTLGYAGRPGGPDFYVSTEDNTRNHGPGGQASYALPGEADPCFGKVVEGFEAVDRMHKMSVQPGGYRRMKNFVAIKSVKILNEA